MEHPFTILTRKVDTMYQRLEKLQYAIENICNEVNIHSKKKLAVQINDLELNMNNLIQTIGINTGKKISVRLDTLERNIEYFRQHMFVLTNKVEMLNQKIDILLQQNSHLKQQGIQEPEDLDVNTPAIQIQHL